MRAFSRPICIALFVISSVILCSAQDPQPKRVVLNGAEFHYIEKGSGEPLILLHGGIGDYRSWNAQIEALAPRFHVISYSRRFSYPNVNKLNERYHAAITDAEDLRSLIKRLGYKKVYLLGHSYGALIALLFAEKHPDMVESMVLAEPPAHELIRDLPGGEALYKDFFAEQEPVAEAFRQSDDRLALTRFNSLMGRNFDALPPQVVESMMANALTLKAINLAADPFPLRDKDRLKGLKIPTLLITGERTTKIHSLVNVELSHLLPNARLVVVPNAGHATPNENPQFFNKVVLNFLTDQK